MADSGLRYEAIGDDIDVEVGRTSPMPLADWMNNHKPTLFFGSAERERRQSQPVGQDRPGRAVHPHVAGAASRG